MTSTLSSRYPPCETFFVESDDVSMAERVREHERSLAKIRQRELAQELSDTTSDEYLEDVLDHMENMEAATMPDVSSIDIQHEIQWYMRPYLLDFLIEAHMAFGLLPETLYLAINLLDRYCSRRVVYKRHYQLVGCAALLIAAKYGDKKDHVPTFRELRAMCCNLYEEEMFLQMEWHVLHTLDYVLGHPTVDGFLKIALAQSAGNDVELEHITWFICENALYHKDFVATRPSVMARSAMALGRHILGRGQLDINTWPGRYDSEVIHDLITHLANPSGVLARKFGSQRYSSVSQKAQVFSKSLVQGNNMHVDAPQAPAYDAPVTPQKSGYVPPVIQFGAMTPPDTPGSENPHGQAACLGYPGAAYPATPSPVPSFHSAPHSASQTSYASQTTYNRM